VQQRRNRLPSSSWVKRGKRATKQRERGSKVPDPSILQKRGLKVGEGKGKNQEVREK